MDFGMIMWKQITKEKQIMLHGYRQLYGLHKTRRYLFKHCKIFLNKVWSHELERPLLKWKI